MNLGRARVQRVRPVARLQAWCQTAAGELTLCRGVQVESASHAIVSSTKQPEQIGERSIVPAHTDFRRLQSCGSSRNVATDEYSAGGLERSAAPPRLCLKLKLPPARSHLLYASRDTKEGKRQFFVQKFEVDAPIVDIDFLQAVCGSCGGGSAVN